MDKKLLIIIILSILVLIGIAYFSYEKFLVYKNKILIQAYNQGVLAEIVEINQKGIIPIIQNVSGNMSIKNVDIKTICEGLK